MIAVINKSTQAVAQADLEAMAKACNEQLVRHAAPAWGKAPVSVVYATSENTMPADATPIYLFDDSDQQGALGYHTEDPDGRIYGRVFVNPVLQNGGTWLNGSTLTVSSVLSHEVVELFVDPNCNLWADSGTGRLYAFEACDPVESDGYMITANNQSVLVSNFVFPEWFDSMSPKGARFDQMSKATSAFTLTSGGYVVWMEGGTVQQTFGAKYPAWRKASKTVDAARTARRLHNRAGD